MGQMLKSNHEECIVEILSSMKKCATGRGQSKNNSAKKNVQPVFKKGRVRM